MCEPHLRVYQTCLDLTLEPSAPAQDTLSEASEGTRLRPARARSLGPTTLFQLHWWGVLAGGSCRGFSSIGRNPSPYPIKYCFLGPSHCVAGAPNLPGVGRPVRPQGKAYWGSSHSCQLTGGPCSSGGPGGTGARISLLVTHCLVTQHRGHAEIRRRSGV